MNTVNQERGEAYESINKKSEYSGWRRNRNSCRLDAELTGYCVWCMAADNREGRGRKCGDAFLGDPRSCCNVRSIYFRKSG